MPSLVHIHLIWAISTFPRNLFIVLKFFIESVAQPIRRIGYFAPVSSSPTSIAEIILNLFFSCPIHQSEGASKKWAFLPSLVCFSAGMRSMQKRKIYLLTLEFHPRRYWYRSCLYVLVRLWTLRYRIFDLSFWKIFALLGHSPRILLPVLFGWGVWVIHHFQCRDLRGRIYFVNFKRGLYCFGNGETIFVGLRIAVFRSSTIICILLVEFSGVGDVLLSHVF